MTRAETLYPVAQVADHREQHAATALAAARRTLAAQETKLAELEQYRDAYVGILDGAVTRGSSDLRETRLFMLRLQQAITQQQSLVRQARVDLEAARAHWLGQRRHVEALNRVMADARLAAERDRLLAEQLDEDERATQRAARRGTS